MKHFKATFLLLLWACLRLNAQLAPACPSGEIILAEDCETACISCGAAASSITFNNGNYVGGNVPQFCSQIQNDFWLAFVAPSTTMSITVIPSNCVNGNGLQAAVYNGCGENFIACNGGGPSNGGNLISLTFNTLKGDTYYLMVDGYSGDICDETINFMPPLVPSDTVLATPAGISGPTQVCPNASVVYSTVAVANAVGYTWTAPPGSLINGQPGPLYVKMGQTVEITFGTQSGQVCVQANSSCATSAQFCMPVTVMPIPPTQLPDIEICTAQLPYVLPWGDTITAPGQYSTALASWQGCDSILQQKIVLKVPTQVSLPDQFVCAGDTLQFLGQQYTQEGNYQATINPLTTCDTTYSFRLRLIQPLAEITAAALSMPCSGGSNELLATADSLNNYLWLNAAGDTLGSAQNLEITQPGLYFLEVLKADQGLQCAAEAFILIASDTSATEISIPPLTLSCEKTPLVIDPGVHQHSYVYYWIGPDGQSSTDSVLTVAQIGTFYLQINDTIAQCISTYEGMIMPTDTALQLTINLLGNDIGNAGVGFIDASLPPGATIKWYFNGVLLAETEDLSNLQAGSYTWQIVLGDCYGQGTVTVSNTVGTQQLSAEAQWQVQPNPAGSYLHVLRRSEQIQAADIFLFDLSGKLLLQRLNSASPSETFELDGLPNGVYFLQIRQANGVFSTCVVKGK